ncbi:hypothetical protein ACLQ2S_20420 [Micromonospora sp. DT48]|uniref:hypothetical protein n=1 Tax=Micromonospora sp. DT48 TaxID=3393429 RepID=UPI003CED794A
MVLILESRSHLDLGDLPNLLAAELGVMTVRLERAIRSLDGVARVHVNRWGDGSAHLHMWFLARPYGRLQLRGTFLSLWDSILPPISEDKWRENLALVAAWLAEFGGRPLAEPPRIQWQAPSSLAAQAAAPTDETSSESGSLLDAIGETAAPPDAPGATVGAERSADPVADAAAEQGDAAPQGGTEADPDGARQEQTEQSAPNTTGPLAEIGGGAQAEIASPATAATGTAEITEPTESTGVADPAEAAEPTDGAESTDAAETSGAAGRADAETNGPKADMVEAQQPAPDADGPRPTN